MDFLTGYIAIDRQYALARGEGLPERTWGAALFADISGFTPLTEALALAFGHQRGAEELSRQLDLVYQALIDQLHLYRGTVIGFSGDAITCWFDQDDGRRASAAGLSMQREMAQFAQIPIGNEATVSLALKVAVSTGNVVRFVVGDPEIQLIDIVAGAPIDMLAEAEHNAAQGEVVLDAVTAAHLADFVEIHSYRPAAETGNCFAIATNLKIEPEPKPWSLDAPPQLTEAQVRPWVLAPVFARLKSGQGSFLAELRPVTALFLRFGKIDYENDSGAAAKLDAYIRWVQSVLAQYEGALLQLTIGDKGSYLGAAFGAPIAHDDDTSRALTAAIELRVPPASLNFIHQVQIGVSRGRMRVGSYGSRTSRTYGMMGDEVNVSARLMQAAAVGQILVTQQVVETARKRFCFETLPPLELKGKRRPVPVFALTHAEALPELHLQEPTYALPMVGRQAELETIAAKMDLTMGGQGQLVGITAEAGMGKSRLVAEIIRIANARGFTGYSGSSQSYGTQTPYLTWHSIWRAFFGLEGDLTAQEQMQRLEEQIADIDPAFVPRVPLLGNVLNLLLPENALIESLDAKLRKSSLEALLVDFVKNRTSVHASAPLLFVLEDSHWIDSLSNDLLEAITRSIVDLPVLIILTYRPPVREREEPARIAQFSHSTIVYLQNFTSEEAVRLVSMKLKQFGGDGQNLAGTWIDKIVERAEGNPFYIEELLNYLRDRGLNPTDTRILGELELPDSLHSLILSRIDQLSETEKVTLKVASIIGRSFPVDWLWGVYPELGTTDRVYSDLEALNQLDLTPLDTPEPEVRYLFKHIVTQQVAYESQPYAARKLLHGNLGVYLEATFADTVEQYIDLLAFHFGHSDFTEKQRFYFYKAGVAAENAYAPETAITYYRQALLLCDADELRLEILKRLGEMLTARARYVEAMQTYSEMLAHARTLDMPVMQSRAWYGLANAQSVQGDVRTALESAAQAELVAQAAGANLELAEALEIKGRSLFRLGDLQAALTVSERTLELLTANGARLQMARSLNLMGAAQNQLGQYAEAEHSWGRAFEIAQELGARRQTMSIANNLGVIAEARGDYRTSLLHYENALVMAHEIGHRDGEIVFRSNLGEARVRLGEYTAAEHDLRQVIEMTQAEGARSRAATYNYLAEALLGQDKREQALDAAQWALTLQQEVGDQAFLAATWRVLGQIAARKNQLLPISNNSTIALYAPADCYATSVTICEERHMEGERARTLREWARYEFALGERESATTKWEEARAIFERLNATFEIQHMAQLPKVSEN